MSSAGVSDPAINQGSRLQRWVLGYYVLYVISVQPGF